MIRTNCKTNPKFRHEDAKTQRERTTTNNLRERRDEAKLVEKGKVLKMLIEEQNIRFQQVFRKFKAIGLLNDYPESLIEPITREMFLLKLKELHEYYQMIINNPTNADELNIAIVELEINMSDTIMLYGDRWNSIGGLLNLWSRSRAEKRKIELELIENEYTFLAENDLTQSKWIEYAQQVFSKHKLLISEQEKLITCKEELYSELDSIYDQRERFYRLTNLNRETGFINLN